MNPSNFVRVVINNLAIKFPSETTTLTLDSSFFCKIKLAHFPSQFAPIPADPDNLSGSVCFTLTRQYVDGLLASAKKAPEIKMDVYSVSGKGCGRRYGFGSSRKLLGRVSLPLPLEGAITHMVVKNGWVKVGERRRKSDVYLHLTVKANPDPRFVFEFDSKPECSPQVFQVQNQGRINRRQPVFSCKFGFKYNKKSKKERKGWSITIHDLSGSPVATASMVTPFVTQHGSGQVSPSCPGAWLILRPSGKKGCWVPWGRLEAWSEGPSRVGYRVELGDVITLAPSRVPARPGAEFIVDMASGLGGRVSPAVSPSGMGLVSDSGSSSESESGFGLSSSYNGFVMSSRVGEEVRVEVGSQHVTCTEDAAVFVALAAAMDLSMEACKSSSHKLRKTLVV